MSKPTLGRGLGDLIGSTDRTKQPPAARPPGVGLRILIDGALRETETTRVVEPAPVANAKPEVSNAKKETDGELLTRFVAIVALIGADLALLGWAAYHALTHVHALSSAGIAGCIGSTLIAAMCGCAATFVIVAHK